MNTRPHIIKCALDPTTGLNASSHRPAGAPQPRRHPLGTLASFKPVRVAGFNRKTWPASSEFTAIWRGAPCAWEGAQNLAQD
jgi:hypothetical protein